MKTNDTSRATVLVISMGFLALHLLFSWQWAIYFSLGVGIAGILSSALSRKIEWAWFKLSRILELFVPKILLGLVFFLVLTPTALLFRMFNKDSLMLSRSKHSLFIERDQEIRREDLEKPW